VRFGLWLDFWRNKGAMRNKGATLLDMITALDFYSELGGLEIT
jgi:hypothetical protein